MAGIRTRKGSAKNMTPEQASPCTRVRVIDNHRVQERRGLLGKVVARYGGEDYIAVDVRLTDGQYRLFWPRDLEEIPPQRLGGAPARCRRCGLTDTYETVETVLRRREKSVQQHQSVQEMAEEVLERQAMALAHQSGDSLEDARQAVSDTEAGRQLRDLAQGEHSYEKAQDWQGSVFWGRAEERLMHLYCSEALSRFVADRHYSWVEGYMEWLEGKEERAQYHALLEEELASLRG
jgi:hypothetical protein